MALEDARGAAPVVGAHGLGEAGHAILQREARCHRHQGVLDQGLVGALDQDAGGLAPGIALDLDGRRGGAGVTVDAGAGERPGVGDRDEGQGVPPVPPDGADVDGMIRSDPIQVVTGGPALLGEIVGHALVDRRLADGHGHDPLAGRGATHEPVDGLEDVVDGARGREGRPLELETLAIHVRVAVEEPRHREPPAQVDPASVEPAEPRDLLVGAQGGDAIAADRQGRDGAGPRVEGHDLAAGQHEVGLGHGAYSTIAPGPGSIGRAARGPTSRAGSRAAGA